MELCADLELTNAPQKSLTKTIALVPNKDELCMHEPIVPLENKTAAKTYSDFDPVKMFEDLDTIRQYASALDNKIDEVTTKINSDAYLGGIGDKKEEKACEKDKKKKRRWFDVFTRLFYPTT